MKNLALPVLFFVVVYVVLILPQGRKRRQAAALARAVEPGSRVLLTSGLYGIVVEIESDTIIIEASEGVHLRFAKAAVLRVVPDLVDPDDAGYDDDYEDEDAADHDHETTADHDHDHDRATMTMITIRTTTRPRREAGRRGGKTLEPRRSSRERRGFGARSSVLTG